MRIATILGLLLVTAVVGAWFARVDIVASTRGEVIARQRTRAVQAPEGGVVAKLQVEEGQRVRAGALLLELDDTLAASEVRRIEARLGEVERILHRVRLGESTAAQAGGSVSAEARRPGPDDGERAAAMARHLRLHALERERLAAALTEADHRIESIAQRAAAIEAERRSVERLVPVLHERAENLARLSARSLAPRHEYLGEQARSLEIEGRTEVLTFEMAREAREADRFRAAQRLLRAEQNAFWQRELVEAKAQRAELRESLIQARRRHAWHRIFAPVDGVVQGLGSLSAGSYVERGQELMSVVPVDGDLEIRAYLHNRDVGFVQAGQEAIVKIDAFPFTRFGTAEGVVKGVSLDTVDEVLLPFEDGSAVTGPGYLVRIALARSAIEVGGTLVTLRPGMHAAVDIRTGQRRLLDYVIAPLVSYGSSALRER